MQGDALWAKLKRMGQDPEPVQQYVTDLGGCVAVEENELRTLAQRYQQSIQADCSLRDEAGLTVERRAELEQIQANGKAALPRLKQGLRSLVLAIATDYVVPHSRGTEYIEAGEEAIMRAASTFQHLHASRLGDYTTVWVERLLLCLTQPLDQGAGLLPWSLLARWQRGRHQRLEATLARRASYTEVAVAAGYLTPADMASIPQRDPDLATLEPALAQRVGRAIAQVETLEKQRQIASEFPLSLVVTIKGSPYTLEGVTGVAFGLAQESEDLMHCGHSYRPKQSEPWRCWRCVQNEQHTGCGRYLPNPRLQLKRQPACVHLYDGLTIVVDNSMLDLSRQFRNAGFLDM